MDDATDWTAHSYEREVVDRVWATAHEVPGNDGALWRKDVLFITGVARYSRTAALSGSDRWA